MRGLCALAALFALVFAPAVTAEAPPVEFGLNELRAALRERGIKIRIRTEITSAAPESYRISSYRVSGGDLRGLMYGLVAAADQIRRRGRLYPESGKPAVKLRGIRRFLHNRDLEQDWFYSRDYWTAYIQMLARNRFNRLNLVFAHQTNYLAPPYPYWVEVEDFPEVRVPGLSSQERKRNLEMLCFIARTAAEHAIDFTLGIWQHDIQHGRQQPTLQGLTEENLGPYTYQALKKVLAACPAIRSVQVRTNWESGIPPERQVSFFRDYVYKALREAGRLVTLDLRGWLMSDGMLEAAISSGVPLRLSSKYWAEHLGRPYQPAETYPNYSYIGFLRRWPGLPGGRPRPYDFFWEIWALGSHRLLLWGDPDYVRRAARTLTLSDSIGFEIDEPLAQKGFGNQPGKWGIFAPGNERRRFWRWEFERYWMFYRLWGRITYDPKVPDRVWMDELKRRFGDAAGEVAEAYRQASRVLNELVAVHLPDPNMYLWPEINPGGLLDYYAAAPAGSRRFVASIRQAVQFRLGGFASARQTPEETARKFTEMAEGIEAALAAVSEKLEPGHREWAGTEPDFRVLAYLARFHAHRQIAALHLVRFYRTGAREAIERARKEAEAALAVWRKLAAFTDGLYPPHMVFGPEDAGHWKDKLPYLEHDLVTLREREWLLERFGRFYRGFDFGAARRGRRLRIRTSVEPRFAPVDPGTEYSEERGYGWATPGERSAHALADAPRRVIRATLLHPTRRHLPENALFGDWISGRGAQVFRVRVGGEAYAAYFLLPEGNRVAARFQVHDGVVDVHFPENEWRVSGLILYTEGGEPAPAEWREPEKPDRPVFRHYVPRRVHAGRPLTLSLTIVPHTRAKTVRLHYRPLNALEKFRTLEAPASRARFTIPAEELTPEWDLLYYFEILGESGAGWFHPDPEKTTPYYVVRVR